MQGKDCNKILPISGCMAATSRSEEAGGFIQILEGAQWGMRDAHTPAPGRGGGSSPAFSFLVGLRSSRPGSSIEKRTCCGMREWSDE